MRAREAQLAVDKGMNNLRPSSTQIVNWFQNSVRWRWRVQSPDGLERPSALLLFIAPYGPRNS